MAALEKVRGVVVYETDFMPFDEVHLPPRWMLNSFGLTFFDDVVAFGAGYTIDDRPPYIEFGDRDVERLSSLTDL